MDDLRHVPRSSMFLSLPPANGHKTRRLSTSSMDSYQSSSSASLPVRKPKHGDHRADVMDDYDVSNDVTLLSFFQTTRRVLGRIGMTSKRVVTSLLKRAKPRPMLVCEGEILEQTSMVCRDYVINELAGKDLLSRRVSIVPADWPNSHHVIHACHSLERAHARVYSNISRKLCLTMTSAKIVRSALTSVLEVLFEGQTTWGKVVAMICIAGLFAEECAVQGHAEFVTDVIDVVHDVTNGKLMDWLVSQGGWENFPYPVTDDGVCGALARLAGALVSAVLLVLASSYVGQAWTSAKKMVMPPRELKQSV